MSYEHASQFSDRVDDETSHDQEQSNHDEVVVDVIEEAFGDIAASEALALSFKHRT